ncbi:hypothetical protein CEXT_296871 [Caerostris extrusa]|uniref:Uncharacterized protein n=1 Tax=Caerostris extrusa TaxID=172846 RepID=A0AAV4UMD8_CAEEX|nr:hypothetical protein CEXT_296871 [Caerostris extrusa]
MHRLIIQHWNKQPFTPTWKTQIRLRQHYVIRCLKPLWLDLINKVLLPHHLNEALTCNPLLSDRCLFFDIWLISELPTHKPGGNCMLVLLFHEGEKGVPSSPPTSDVGESGDVWRCAKSFSPFRAAAPPFFSLPTR